MIAATAHSSSDLEAKFLAVYAQEGPGVLRYLRTRAQNLSEAEELHAETFYRAWEAWGRFRGEKAEIRPWLFRIARNLLIDRHRRKRHFWFLPLEERHGSGGSDEVATTATGRILLQEVVRRISTTDRELLALRVAGLSHAEIGKIQGRSEQAVKVAWHRALERMRTHVEGIGHGG